MTSFQPGILSPIPPLGRYLELRLVPDQEPESVLGSLAEKQVGDELVIGLGPGLMQGMGHAVDGLAPFPGLSGPGCEVPSTQADLWVWIRGEDRGQILPRGRAVSGKLRPAFSRERMVDGFRYENGLDLSGYEDGTENPVGEAAVAAAIVNGAGDGLDGGSFVAVQQWAHDLYHFQSLPAAERDNVIGRRASDNEKLDDAPASAHVKRTAQESFDPEAFLLRRSMPWADAGGEGLMFVAFGSTLYAFDAQLRRMVGEEDGIAYRLFRFSRPISGSYFWCPPIRDGRLDLSALGL